ncbi:FAP50 [Symbiodinium sp. CCMP2456]|nr:FAP50 [Symbiodinium sp. CCMP2456]
MRRQETFPDGKDAVPGLFSARFDGKPTEHKFRRVYEILKAHNYPVLMVSAKCGVDFGDLTMNYLSQIEENHGKLICVCTAHYAEMTASPFSSFHEFNYAQAYKLDVLPLKVEDIYPPRPPSGKDHPYDKDGRAKALIKMVFRPNLAFTDVRDLDEKEIARVIADSLLKSTGTLVMTSLSYLQISVVCRYILPAGAVARCRKHSQGKALDMDEKKARRNLAGGNHTTTPPGFQGAGRRVSSGFGVNGLCQVAFSAERRLTTPPALRS